MKTCNISGNNNKYLSLGIHKGRIGGRSAWRKQKNMSVWSGGGGGVGHIDMPGLCQAVASKQSCFDHLECLCPGKRFKHGKHNGF